MDCRKWNVRVMGIESKTIGMFTPILQAIVMLKGHPLTEHEAQVIEQLDEMRKPLPDAWNILYKKSLNVRAQNSLVQDREAEKIKEQMARFEGRLTQISKVFRSRPFFSSKIDFMTVYEDIDRQNLEFIAVDKEAKDLQNLQELFDLTASEFKELRECNSELVMLRTCLGPCHTRENAVPGVDAVDVQARRRRLILGRNQKAGQATQVPAREGKSVGMFHGAR